jgi:pentatricopeptide repeat protein
MAKQADKALEVVRMMQELGIRPDIVTYNALLDACEKNDRLEDAQRIMEEEIPRQGLVPNVITFTTMINLYGKRKMLVQALALYQDAIKMGLKPELKAYTAVIKVRYHERTWLMEGCVWD